MTTKADEIAEKAWLLIVTGNVSMSESLRQHNIGVILAALHEYGALVRARDAEVAREVEERGPVCDDEEVLRLLHESEAGACAAAISREPQP